MEPSGPGSIGRPDGQLAPPFPVAGSSTALPRPRYTLAAALLLLTFFSTTTLGAMWSFAIRTDVETDLLPWLGVETVSRVWSEPALLRSGLSFSLPLLFILLCHELGHYLACRRYQLPATLPYFLPAPFGVGTLGAFIRIRAPIRSKRQLFDVGVAGPLAGAAAVIPILLFGIAHSSPATFEPATPSEPGELILFLPGQSLAMKLAAYPFHGVLPDGVVLDFHPFALAAWVGLLATSLNLLPLGQLDGGHILYASLGRHHRKLALPLWGALGVAGFYWQGWLVWWFLIFFFGIHHPPVWDEHRPLGRGRQLLAVVAVLLLILTFMPVPLTAVPVRR